MATIGSLAVNIVARTDRLTKGLRQAEKSVKGFATRIVSATAKVAKFGAAITAAGVAAGTVFVRNQLAAMDAIAKTSDRLGITTEALTGLMHASDLAGISQTELETGMRRMLKTVSDAQVGLSTATRAFEGLGLSASQLATLSPDQQFVLIADALNRVESQADKTRMAMDIFGRSGSQFLSLTQHGSEGIREMMQEAERLGQTFDENTKNQIEATVDAITRMKAAFAGVVRTVTIQLAPGIERMANSLTASLDAGGALRPIFDAISHSFDFIQDAIGKIHVLFLKMRVGINQMINGVIIGMQKLGNAVMRLVNKVAKSRLGKLAGIKQGRLTSETGNQSLSRQIERDIAAIAEIQNEARIRAAERLQDRSERSRSAVHQLPGMFGRFAGSAAGRVNRLFEQLAEVGRKLPQSSAAAAIGPRASNAALEAGTREAYIASRSGRNDPMKQIAREQAKEVKLSEAGNKILSAIRDRIGQTVTAVTIPSA